MAQEPDAAKHPMLTGADQYSDKNKRKTGGRSVAMQPDLAVQKR